LKNRLRTVRIQSLGEISFCTREGGTKERFTPHGEGNQQEGVKDEREINHMPEKIQPTKYN